ncbi:MAG TPA: aldolase/citrate lyase family protein [Chloroflexota bacterium]|nr:aldolase/citrate lyase family protein [Chloroflexota bacterium]
MKIRRSVLVVPAISERMVQKAHELPADVIQLDLQDSVPRNDEAKSRARAAAAVAIRTGGFRAHELNVRINGPRSPWFEQDVEAVVSAGVESLALPDTQGVDDVLAAEQRIHDAARGRHVEVILDVETPRTLLELEAVATRCTLVTALVFGPADYSLGTGSYSFVTGDLGESTQLNWARQKMLMVAKAMGWTALDAVGARDPQDVSAVFAAMRSSRNLGFDGCGVLYPRHLELANEAYAPTKDELDWATNIIAAYEALDPSRAAGLVDGRLVLPAHYEFARRLRDLAATVENLNG